MISISSFFDICQLRIDTCPYIKKSGQNNGYSDLIDIYYIYDLFADINGSLCGCKSCNRHPVRRAAHIIKTLLIEELN